jgi:hypothetical protein
MHTAGYKMLPTRKRKKTSKGNDYSEKIKQQKFKKEQKRIKREQNKKQFTPIKLDEQPERSNNKISPGLFRTPTPIRVPDFDSAVFKTPDDSDMNYSSSKKEDSGDDSDFTADIGNIPEDMLQEGTDPKPKELRLRF